MKWRINNDFTPEDRRRWRAALWTTVATALLMTGCWFLHSMRGDGFDFSTPSHHNRTAKEKPYDETLKDRRDPYRNYPRIFSDLQETQLAAATKNGIKPGVTRQQLQEGVQGMTYIEDNDYYALDPLTHSSPYLVDKAAKFLDDLGQAFQDSLYNRGYNRNHRFIVTSVTRTADDVRKLSRQNVNATENSCHLYGTTMDITYVRFSKPEDHVANDMKLQQLLFQTVYDFRKSKRCYVKYEVKQSCLHITVR